MKTRTVKVVVTDEDGVILDAVVLNIQDPEQNTYIAVRPVNYSIGQKADEEVLDLGKP